MASKFKYSIFFIALLLFGGFMANSDSLITFLLGTLCCYAGLTKKATKNTNKRMNYRFLFLFLGILFILISFLQMRYIGLVIIGFIVVGIISLNDQKEPDNLIFESMRETQIPDKNVNNHTYPFIDWDELRLGNTYISDGDNLSVISGLRPTLLDFGQLYFTRGQHLGVIFKVGGNLKIIIPKGMQITLYIHQYRGNLLYHNEAFTLNNERRKIQIINQVANPRTMQMNIYMGWGDIEVIEL